jgi:Tfp pilus assembly protein FimT
MMTFATGTCRNKGGGFTLIELVLVMVIMIVVLGTVFPSLKGFFHARNLDNEARQFLSLTRYGQARAIAEGIPVELWINPRLATYGLNTLPGYTESQTNPVNYALDSTVQIAFSAPSSVLTRSNMWTPTPGQNSGLARIRFQPDGFISDSSPENVFFQQRDTGDELWIAETPTHLRYVLQTGQPQSRRR